MQHEIFIFLPLSLHSIASADVFYAFSFIEIEVEAAQKS